jgi:hypothetical protein
MNNFLEISGNNFNNFDKDNIKFIITNIYTKLSEKIKNIDENDNIKKQYESILSEIDKIFIKKDKKDDNSNYLVENVDKLCRNIEFNGDIKTSDYENENISKDNPFGDAYTSLPEKYQYVIGRINTLSEISETNNLYKNNRIKILYLDSKHHQKDWSIFINDLFIYCSIIYDRQIYNEKSNKKVFGIRLIYDKTGCNETRNLDKTYSTDSAKKCIDSKENLETQFDTVTFREIIIICHLFGLKCYKYIGSDYIGYDNNKYETYFFSNIDYETDNKYENITEKVKKWITDRINNNYKKNILNINISTSR